MNFLNYISVNKEADIQCTTAKCPKITPVHEVPAISRPVAKTITSNSYNLAPIPNYVKLLPKIDPRLTTHTIVDTNGLLQTVDSNVHWINDNLLASVNNQQGNLQIVSPSDHEKRSGTKNLTLDRFANENQGGDNNKSIASIVTKLPTPSIDCSPNETIPCVVQSNISNMTIDPVQITRVITIPTSGSITNAQTMPQTSHNREMYVPNIAPSTANPGAASASEQRDVSVPKRTIRRRRFALGPAQPRIHLLKTGETYRSLEKLDDEKLKVITNALMSIGDPLTSKKKSVYDGETKTRIKYRVIYPNDFDLTETNEITIKGLDKPEMQRQHETPNPPHSLKKQHLQKGPIDPTHSRYENIQNQTYNDMPTITPQSAENKVQEQFTNVRNSNCQQNTQQKNTNYQQIQKHITDFQQMQQHNIDCQQMQQQNSNYQQMQQQNIDCQQMQQQNSNHQQMQQQNIDYQQTQQQNTNYQQMQLQSTDYQQTQRKNTDYQKTQQQSTGYQQIQQKNLTPKRNKNKKQSQEQNETHKTIVTIKKDNATPKYKIKRRRKKKIDEEEEKLQEKEEVVKMTRSGRTVKLPKTRGSEEMPKPKFRRLTYIDVLTCLHCHEKFHGVPKLTRHYETYPSHTPKIMHTNLFQCFLDVMKGTPASEKGYTFVEQLEELIVKIRNMLPCMINNIDSNDGKLCCINEDLGKMLEIEPGKYNISFGEAINCYEKKQTNEKCKHFMKSNIISSSGDLSKPSQVWVAKHNEEIALMESEEVDCARTNSVDKWPLIKKRIRKYIPLSRLNEKLQSPSQNIDVTTVNNNEEIKSNNDNAQTAKIWFVPKKKLNITNKKKSLLKVAGSVPISVLNLDTPTENADQINLNIISLQDPFITKDNVICTEPNQPSQTQNQLQFQSSHFDIRSSPIKSSNTSFNKIQIRDSSQPLFVKLTNEETQRNADVNNLINSNVSQTQDSEVSNQLDLNGMFSELNGRDVGNQSLSHTGVSQEIKMTDLYDRSSEHLQPMSLDVDTNQKEYNVHLGTTSTGYCEISQNGKSQNDRLLSSAMPQSCLLSDRNTHMGQSDATYLLSSGNAPVNQSDRLLSSGDPHRHNDRLLSTANVAISQSNHILSSRSQNDCLLSSANTKMGQNDHLSSGNSHTAQSDRLLSSGSAPVPQNDRLLSSGNLPLAQNDSLVNMCVNESNLEGSRMGLQLLDHLGSDCLSFTDTELRNASLELPLDLFPFNHPE